MIDPMSILEKEEPWFTPDISREQLKGFLKKDNWHALYMVGLWLVLLAATGYLAFSVRGTWWAIPAFFLYGVIYSACDARWHESSHGTVFRTPWLNGLLHFWATAMQQRDIVFTKWSHARHHSFTVFNDVDLEITVPRPPKLFPQIINFLNIQQGLMYIRILFQHTLGIVSTEAGVCVPEDEYRQMFGWARLSFLVNITPVVLAVVFRSWLPVLFFGLPRFYGAPIQWAFILQQHAGLDEDVWDHRRNSRTVKVNPFFGFLFMNMNYHIEHHVYPLVPFHALPKLHEAIKDECPAPYNGLGEVYRELIPALLKQKKDTSFYIPRPMADGREPKWKSHAPAGEPTGSGGTDAGESGRWIRVCAASDIPEDDVIQYSHDGKVYAVFNLKKKGYFATDGLCTHEQAPLWNGVVEDSCRVACPKHNARFDIVSGKALTRPAKEDLRTYPVRLEGDTVLLDVSEVDGDTVRDSHPDSPGFVSGS